MRDFFINLDANRADGGFVQSFSQAIPAVNLPQFARSDSFPIRLMFVRETQDITGNLPFYYIDPAGFSSVKFGGGEIGATPDGGTFTLTSSVSGTTTGLAYNASAVTVQTALRLIGGLTACTVTGSDGGPFTVDSQDTANAGMTITGSAAALAPDGSTVVIVKTQNANGSLTNRWNISLAKAYPILITTGWTALPSAGVTVTTVQAGSATQNKTFQVEWNADAYAGTVMLTFTGDTTTGSIGPIPFSANADAIAAAFAAHVDIALPTNVGVVKNNPGKWTVTMLGAGIANSNTPALATSSNTLQVPVGLTAVCPVSTAGADALLGTADSVDITIEVEVREASGQPNTAAQATTQLIKDLIVNTPGQATGNEDWATIGDVEAISEHIFDDTAERTADVPYRIGQLGFQLDTQSLWHANGTGAGDWEGVFSFLQVNAGIPGESAGSVLIYEVDGDFYSELLTTGITANRQVFLPDLDGTLALTSCTLAYTAKTATYAITNADCVINCTANTFTVTLPTAVGIAGKVFNIKNSGAGTITVATTSAQTVDGTTPPSITPGVNLTVCSDNANWIIL